MSKKIEKRRAEIVAGENIPQHIAIIMDGNGRWAKEKNRPRVFGHREGINSVRDVTRECGKLGVEVLTLYTFSVENWSRPRNEISALMKLLVSTVKREVKELNKNNVQLSLIGQIEDLPDDPRQELLKGVEKTSRNTGLQLNLALSYGGRQEIIHGVKQIAKKIEQGKLSSKDIDEKVFADHLFTAGLPDPDLLIRTSGEMRVSNFLLWQMAYTEIYVTQTYWPDFREMELLKAINDYQRRERRFGKTSEQVK
ncbi:MAG: isoprenyl transferase [Candidatus Marinimicrobia bacterium]|nr:isoprenyl transferase [Candidatus Neomarinimicrobiota bacterium]